MRKVVAEALAADKPSAVKAAYHLLGSSRTAQGHDAAAH
jgi:hypothetical protein